jgi:large subunit ribosomal protein L22
MSKTANKPRRKENEAFAKARYIKGSERKLNLLAQLIRGKAVSTALIDLEFSRKRMSGEVKKVLESAIANAENNHNLDVDRLIVKEATVGRTMTLKRFHARGRGKSAGVEKPFANITIIVSEKAAEEKKEVKKTAKKGSKDPKKAAAKTDKAE